MTTLKAAMIEASMALANWQKYNANSATDEIVYQAEKVAQSCATLIEALRADRSELIEKARARANALPKEIADRENEADSHCGSYGTATAEDFMDDPDVLLLHDLADALAAI